MISRLMQTSRPDRRMFSREQVKLFEASILCGGDPQLRPNQRHLLRICTIERDFALRRRY